MIYLQNNPVIPFLKTLSDDVSETLKNPDFKQDTTILRTSSVALRLLGGLVAFDTILLAAKTIVVIAAGGWILPNALAVLTLFQVVLAHDLLQAGHNLRPETGFISAVTKNFKNDAKAVFKNTIAFQPLLLAYEYSNQKHSH